MLENAAQANRVHSTHVDHFIISHTYSAVLIWIMVISYIAIFSLVFLLVFYYGDYADNGLKSHRG